MKGILTETEIRIQEIVLEHTRLAREHFEIYNDEGSEEKCKEIKKRIEDLRKERDELLFRLEVDKHEM